ncbi:unnamed protein product [Alopecurus aequalis]
MPPRNQPKISEAPSAAKIDDLPNGVLAHIISFLPAHDAVRTSMLARRWRHLWTSAPALRITAVGGFGTAERFNNFVDRLILLRGKSGCPLRSCEFDLDRKEFGFDWFLSAVHVWSSSLQSALDCDVQVLRCRFRINDHFDLPLHLPGDPLPLLSQHLERLELHRVRSVLDFSCCPALVDLKMVDCVTLDDKLTSPSLKHLSMISCHLQMYQRTTMSLPSLVRLELIDCNGRLPSLQSFPSLETAFVRIGEWCDDRCLKDESGCSAGKPCKRCQFYFQFDSPHNSSFFLQGLARAKHLELSAYYDDALLFQRDLKWCPPFTMLKTLILDDWCLDADLSAVIRFLQHLPNLEKLTLKLDEEFDSSMVTGESNNLVEGTFSSDHLKMVKIKCEKVDKRIHKILKILSTCGISLEKVNIRQTNTSSGSGWFDFVCTGFSCN